MHTPARRLYRSVSQRLGQARRTVLGPLFRAWFKAETQDRIDWMYPTGEPQVGVEGINPVRILVIGDGPAAGLGVRTHQLGIAGHLARHLVELIARGVVVTVLAQPAASARSTLKRLGDMDIDGYDSIVLMLATTDAFCLTSRRSWRRNLSGLIHALTAADASSVFVTSAASLHLARPLSPFARHLTGRHARTLNAETKRICARTNTPMIVLDAASGLTSRTYAKWGRRIGVHVADSLHKGAPLGPPKPRPRVHPRSVAPTGRGPA